MNDFYSMLELTRSHPLGLSELIEKHGATTSYELAGPLLAVLKQLLQDPSTAEEARSALFGLTRTLRVWEMDPWAAEGLLNTLSRAIFDYGVPRDANRYALAELIWRASAQDEGSMGSRLDLLNLSTINLCCSLANWGELLSVLSLCPGARESVTRDIERMKLRLPKADTELYSDEIECVLKALRE